MSFEKCLTKYRSYVDAENSREDVADDGGIVEESRGRGKMKVHEEKIAEVNEVEQLRLDLAPVSKHSDIIQKLEQKRKIRHESLLKKLADDLNELNLKIEENLSISSEEVKAHIRHDKNHLKELLTSFNVPEVASYHESVFFEIRKKADEMKTHQLLLVHDLYKELNKMEDLRAIENERIFRSTFTEIERNAHISSYELQHFIEHEALKMNQISLNNRRCFEDLKLKLILGCEHRFKSFMDEVFCLREKWIRFNEQEALDNVISKIDPATVMPEPEFRTELKGHELILQPTPDNCYNLVTQEEWFRNVKGVMRTVEIYKIGIAELFLRIRQAIGKNMSSECDDVRRALTSLDILEFQVRCIQPIFSETWDNFKEYEEFWQYCFKKVENLMKDVAHVLLNFGDLWTSHNRRLCESKILVLKAVEKAEESNRLVLQDLESKLNLNLDLLREESNEEKITNLYNSVKNNLDAIRDRLGSNYAHEISVAEEFHKMMDLEADVLSSDIKEFIHTVHSPAPIEEGDSESQFAPEIADTKFGGLIQEFSSRMDSLKILKSEMYKDLECFANDAKERLKWRGEEWSKNRIREISMKYQIQMEIHSKRYDRVRIQIYEVRLEEIRVHKQVYDEHKAAVDDVRKTLIREVENLYEKGGEHLDECKMKLSSTIEELKKEERAEVVKYIQSQMTREKFDFINDFKSKSEIIRGEIELRISSTQNSNLKFMKSIKMFHENGNYDADEAKFYVDALEGIDREVSAEARSMIKDVNKKESQITQKATEIFDAGIRVLAQLYEELRFHADVKNLTNLCQADFQGLETELKSDFLLLVEEYESLVVRHSVGNLPQELDDAWIILIQRLCKNMSNIFYKLEPPQWQPNPGDAQRSENGLSEVCTQDSRSKTEKWTRPGAKIDFSTKDYTQELFETSLLTANDSSFVNRTCYKILNCMAQIQTLGSTFYKKPGSKSLIRKDLLQTNYEDFGQCILQTFRIFAAQSEQVWLKTVENFFPLLCQIKASFKTYIERRTREYSERVMAALDNYRVNFTECLIENECNFWNAFQSFDNRLLPLHGCPRNKALLESLQEEVVQKTAELELNWESFIKKYKSDLKQFRMLYTIQYPEWGKLHNFYSYMENILFADVTGQDIVDYMCGVVERRGFVKRLEKGGGKESLSVPGSGVSHTGDKRNSKYLNELLLDNDTYLSDIKQMIDSEIVESAKSAGHEFYPGIKLLQNSVDFCTFVQPYVTRMNSRYKEVQGVINCKSDFHKEIIFDWLDKWKMNVGKITELYTVVYGHGEEPSEKSSESSKCKVSTFKIGYSVSAVFMAELKTVKSKKIKTCAVSGVPKLSLMKANRVEPTLSIRNRKSRSVGNRSSSYEKRTVACVYENGERESGKCSKTIQTESKSEVNEKERSMSNVSFGSVSPSKRQSQIPVLSRNSPKSRGSRKKAASVDMISPKTVIISNGKIGPSRKVNYPASNQSRSPSPLGMKSNNKRPAEKTNVRSRSRSYGSRSLINNAVERTGTRELCAFDSDSLHKKKQSAVSFNKSCTTITLCSPRADSDTLTSEILTPHSQGNVSSYTNEDLSPADMKDVNASTSASKSSSDYNVGPCSDLGCQEPHCSGEYSEMCQLNNIDEDEPQLELLDLHLKDSESQLFTTVPGSTATSVRKTASDDSLKLDDLQTPKTTIRTISGDELVLSSSMEFDIENDLRNNDLPNESEDTIKELLDKTEDDSFAKVYTGIHLIEDDAYEYDSEGTTDADVPSKSNCFKSEVDSGNGQNSPSEPGIGESVESTKVNWRSRENELLTDVHYRQFLYHPAVMRRKSREGYKEDRLRSDSIEDRTSFRISDDSEGENDATRRRNSFKKNALQAFVTEKNLSIGSDNTLEEEEKEMFDRLNMIQNTDYVSKEIKRERTKRERITSAVLRITAKFIHLLAILNLWPGDNCQLLTSHTLRYGR